MQLRKSSKVKVLFRKVRHNWKEMPNYVTLGRSGKLTWTWPESRVHFSTRSTRKNERYW